MDYWKEIGRQCYNAAKQRWGRAWNLLSDVQKEREIEHEIVRLLMAQATEHAEPAVKALQGVARHAYKTLEEKR